MKIVTILLSFMLLLGGCLPQVDLRTYYEPVHPNMNETLIALQAKILKSGTLYFFSRNGEVFKETSFTYYIDIKKKQAFCTKERKKNFIIDENDIPSGLSGLTAESFKQIEKDREDYFNCFAMNFLDMSNDEKIKVLEEIAKRPKKNDK